MAKEMKWTDAMEELRLYIVNTNWCIDVYEGISKEVVERGKLNDDGKIIVGYKFLKRAAQLARDAARAYREEIGAPLGRIGCRQIEYVGYKILREQAQEMYEFHAKYGHY